MLLKQVRYAATVAVIALTATAASAANSALSGALCEVLKKLLPEVRTYKPEGAQAQLVMTIADKFNYDPAKLQQVQTEIDQATSASCPKEREAYLSVLKMKSLAEAVR
ncbi:MAG: hypothetical protein ABI564_08945 [Ideonella sp.]